MSLRQLSAAGQVNITGSGVDVGKSEIACDLGNFTGSGNMNQCEVSGSVDLARLAAMLPATLHIRKETQITSGQLKLSVSAQEQAGANGQKALVVHGQIGADNLVAINNGRQISWPNPVTLAPGRPQHGPGPDYRQPAMRFRFPQDSRRRHSRQHGRLAQPESQATRR